MTNKIQLSHKLMLPVAKSTSILPIDVEKLTTITDASCFLINVSNCHDLVNLCYGEFLPLVISKLKYGGKIIIQGIDLFIVSDAIFTGTMQIEDAQNLLFENKTRCGSGNQIAQILQNLGLKVISHKTTNYLYSITAERSLNES